MDPSTACAKEDYFEGPPEAATLGCVVSLYGKNWHAKDVFARSQVHPRVVYREYGKLENEPENAVRTEELMKNKWVIRQSLHHDRNVHVCARAQVWLEIADRPRWIIPVMPDRTVTVADITSALEQSKLPPRAWPKIRRIRLPSDASPLHMWPAAQSIVEPQQDIFVEEYEPTPDPPPSDSSTVIVAAAGALIAYGATRAVIGRRRPEESAAAASPPGISAPPPRRSGSIRLQIKAGPTSPIKTGPPQ